MVGIHAVYDTHIVTPSNKRHYVELTEYISDPEAIGNRDAILLDESLFSYDSRNIYRYFTDPVSVDTIYALTAERENTTRNPLRYERAYISHDLAICNGEKVVSILGKRGHISFRMHAIYRNITLTSLLNQHATSEKREHCMRLPRSHYTIQFIKQHLEKESFGIFTIDEIHTKYITVQQGRITNVQRINYGTRILKEILNSQRLKGLYYHMMGNTLQGGGERLCIHVINDFLSVLFDWMHSATNTVQTTFCISSLLKSEIFAQSICQGFKTIGFLFPFYYAEYLKDKNKKYDLLHKDLLTAISFLQHM